MSLAETTTQNVATPVPAAAQQEPLLNLTAFEAAQASTDPYQHIMVDDILVPGAAERLESEFPSIDVTGYITMNEANLTPLYQQLLDELMGPGVTEALSKAFGRDMHAFPRMVTIHRWSALKEGHIHTDSERKIMTMLLYMNPSWIEGSGGRLRVLYDGKNFEPYAKEIPPLNGTAFAFTRSDNSWHGHLPFEGERRVIQVTWLRDAEAMNRKKSNNGIHQMLKRLFSGKKAKPVDMM